MVFSTGYQANLATIAGLASSRDVVLIDADSHASIYDACKLSGVPSQNRRELGEPSHRG